ncbi:MAG: hypothetical protein JWN73_4391 [Betaproteobacteria bacterium]|nr:hypothetical protein [Betaproteobacteria bacterium]
MKAQLKHGIITLGGLALSALLAAPLHAEPAPGSTAVAPKQGPAPTVGMPGNIDCAKAENRKEPVCNQQADPGIARAPAVNEDPKIARTPPPTGDGAKAGPGAPDSRIGRNEGDSGTRDAGIIAKPRSGG